MDGSRFDDIARNLAGTTTRRTVLRALLGGVAGAVGLSRGGEAAACRGAGRSCTSNVHCCSGNCDPATRKCACAPGTAICRNDCLAPDAFFTDVNNCGTCGTRCPVPPLCLAPICSGGVCSTAPDPNQVGHPCGDGKVCQQDGTCGCPTGQIACGGTCVDTATNQNHCGGCGQPCGSNQTCVSGVCKGNLGAPCSGGGACVGGICADGVCCESACGGQCEGCNSSGLCRPVSGAPIGGRAQCGGSGACAGVCDGTQGAMCAYPSGSTTCQSATCNDGDATKYFCNGAGACVSSTIDCGLFVCEGGACLTTCADDGDCRGEAFCDGEVCAGDRPIGQPCDRRDQCQSGHCAGGVCSDGLPNGANCTGDLQCISGICSDTYCCDRRCDGGCEGCDGGVCGTFRAGTGSCGGTNSVICGGQCDGVSPNCVYPGTETVCGGDECPPGNKAVTFSCDGTGTCVRHTVECGAYRCAAGHCPTSCTDSNQCIDGHFCRDSDCRPDLANGEECDADNECASGLCRGGICCQDSCPDPFGGTAVCGAGGTGCEITCDDGFNECGDACCQDTFVCCPSLDGESHVCCGEGGECVDGQCTVFCVERSESCTASSQCCQDEGAAICDHNSGIFEFVCCSELGGTCDAGLIEDWRQCCMRPMYPPYTITESDFVYCASPGTAGEGTCGGAGALCLADQGCLSGECCNVSGLPFCCDVGERCTGGNVCKKISGPCSSGGECASGLCCGGQCVERNDDHCSHCADVCPENYTCDGAQCKKAIGQFCGSGSECADGYCYEGICCDECGGACGKPRENGVACSAGHNARCCGGDCYVPTPGQNVGCPCPGEFCPVGDICTADRRCTCTESTEITYTPEGLCRADFKGCRGNAGLCVTSTDGELFCAWGDRMSCEDTCTTSDDCAGTICTTINGVLTCTSEWVCTRSTCCGNGEQGVCAIAAPGS